MYGPFYGEFMGTLVLILLGDGAVANVLLKKSKGENSGWIVITTAWGMAGVAGIFTAIAFGSPGAHINPAITLTVAVLSGNWSNVALFWTAQILGRFRRSQSGVDDLSATLESDARPWSEAGDFLHRTGDSQSPGKSVDRNYCHHLSDRRWF